MISVDGWTDVHWAMCPPRDEYILFLIQHFPVSPSMKSWVANMIKHGLWEYCITVDPIFSLDVTIALRLEVLMCRGHSLVTGSGQPDLDGGRRFWSSSFTHWMSTCIAKNAVTSQATWVTAGQLRDHNLELATLPRNDGTRYAWRFSVDVDMKVQTTLET